MSREVAKTFDITKAHEVRGAQLRRAVGPESVS